jgi:hypothetical protein
MGSELPPPPPARNPEGVGHRAQRILDYRIPWIVILVVVVMAFVGLWVLRGLHHETALFPHDNLFHPHECLMWHDFRLSCHVT